MMTETLACRCFLIQGSGEKTLQRNPVSPILQPQRNYWPGKVGGDSALCQTVGQNFFSLFAINTILLFTNAGQVTITGSVYMESLHSHTLFLDPSQRLKYLGFPGNLGRRLPDVTFLIAHIFHGHLNVQGEARKVIIVR